MLRFTEIMIWVSVFRLHSRDQVRDLVNDRLRRTGPCVTCPNFRMHLCCAQLWGQRCPMKPADNGILPIRQLSPGASAAIPTEPFINATQASGLLHLSAKTLLRFTRQGVIPAHPLTGKTRKQWRFLES